MGAGEGAARQARNAAERAAKLRQQLDNAERAERSWAAGAAGEAKVGAVLEALQPYGWSVLHDMHWPGRPKANLDHVLLGPGGVIVVDAKNWSGDVELRNGALRQNGYSRERQVTGVLDQSASVAALLEPQHRRHVQGWIALVGQPDLEGVTASGVQICGVNTLQRAVTNLPQVLDPTTVLAVHQYLANLLAGASSPPLLTTAKLPAGPASFAREGGAATSLAGRRTAGVASSNQRSRTDRRPRHWRASRRASPNYLAIFVQLSLVIFGVGVLVNLL